MLERWSYIRRLNQVRENMISGVLRISSGKLARDTVGIGMAKLLAVPFSLGLAILLAKGLGPNSYGRYAFAVSLLNLMALLVAGGLASLLTREVAIARETDELGLVRGITRLSTVWIMVGCALLIGATTIVVYAASSGVGDGFNDMLLIGLVGLPFACFVPVWSGILRGFGEAMQSQLPSLLALPVFQGMLIAALVAIERLDERTAMMSFVLSNIAVAATGMYLVRRHSGPKVKAAPPITRLGPWSRSWFVLTQLILANYLNIQAGVLLLGFLASHATVGAYQIADRVSQFVVLSIGILELVIAPYVAQAFRSNRLAEVSALFAKARIVGLVLAIPVAAPFVLFGGPIIDFVFGEQYVAEATAPLAILSVVLLLRVATGPASTLLVMSGRERVTLVAQIIAVVLNVAVSILLIPRLGSTGAALGAGAGTLAWSALMALQARRLLRNETIP